MSSEIDVSVIVPVYNAQEYLAQCLDSIMAQTLKNIEIICVDDGSDDASLSILQAYAERDPRFILRQQNHAYAGMARNLGKSIASGKYLVFWDSDDYFFPEALEKMFRQCESDQADVCICSGRQYFEDLKLEVPGLRYLRKRNIPEVIPFNVHTAPEHILCLSVEAPWNKMFRRSFVEEKGLSFQPVRNANDVYFVESALCMAQKVTIVREELVCYRKHKTTGLVSGISKGLLSAIQTWLDTADNLRKNQVFPERSFANRSLESILYLLNNTSDWDSYEEGFRFLQNGNLEKLSIRYDVEEDYYYIKEHREVAMHLFRDSPQQFAKWIGTLYFMKEAGAVGRLRSSNEKASQTKKDLKALEKEYKSLQNQFAKLQKKYDDVISSASFRIGRAATALPRHLKADKKQNR